MQPGALGRFVGLVRAHQPNHAIDRFHAEVARALRQVGAEGDMGAQLRLLQLHAHWLRQHLHDRRVLTVQHHQPRLAKNACLGCAIGSHASVPVQVVLREVEHHGRSRLEVLHTVELEARQLQHPHLGQILRSDARGQCVEQRRADVAGHGHAAARVLHQLARERGDGGFAVGAGHGQHGGRVAVLRTQGAQRLRIQVQFAAKAYLASASSFQNRSKRSRCEAG